MWQDYIGQSLRAKPAISQSASSPDENRTHPWLLVGESKPIQAARAAIQLLGNQDIIVVIVGRSGTGKEVVANLLHLESRRAQAGSFVAVNCAALPREIAESSLMGHMKGAFTGAVRDHRGLVEQAHRGTLFLDEFGDLSLDLQAKILRVIEEGKVRRVGDEMERSIDVRIVIAVKRPLEELVREGLLREDLFYRLGSERIHLPPLSERREDIPLLVDHFNRIFARTLGRPPLDLGPEVPRCLRDFEWAGNVRELRSEIESLHAKCLLGQVQIEHLSLKIQKSRPPCRPGRKPRDRAGDQVRAREAMRVSGSNCEKARRLLDISRSTLYEWLRG